jgi:hypothetical protein
MGMGGFRSGETKSMQTITTHRVSLINLPDTRPFYTCNRIGLNLTCKIMAGIRIYAIKGFEPCRLQGVDRRIAQSFPNGQVVECIVI